MKKAIGYKASGRFKKGCIPWNKGLKKVDNDSINKAVKTRLKNGNEWHNEKTKSKIKKTLKEKYKNNEIKIWNKNLTKDNNKILAEISKKNRLIRVKQIKKDGFYSQLGKNEKQLLNEQEKIDNCKIKRQFLVKGLGYTVDGYCHETNTIYEVYEK